MERIVLLSKGWVAGSEFEQALRQTHKIDSTSLEKPESFLFRFPPSCKIMVDAAVRLLSFANQRVAQGQQVTLLFEGQRHEAMNYLNRANFFALLAEQVQVQPHRPDTSEVKRYQGQNRGLVEFRSIHPLHNQQDDDIPGQLTKALETAMEKRPDMGYFRHTAYTTFAELVNNIYGHSQTVLSGFAALQVYQQGGRVLVVVSDSGIGLLTTLRPKLMSPTPLNDTETLRQLFQGTLTWKHGGAGQGLEECGMRALKLSGSVTIRLETCSVYLTSSDSRSMRAAYQEHLVPLAGTHICFSFPLDTPH